MRYLPALMVFAATGAGAQFAEPPVVAKLAPLCVDAVKEKLRDPETARFERVEVAILHEGQWVAHVRVNAKNAFGGYTGVQGWQCFVDRAARRVLGVDPPV